LLVVVVAAAEVSETPPTAATLAKVSIVLPVA
jgi:hypothetical protein